MAAQTLAASIALQLPLTLRKKSEKLARHAGVSLSSLILTALNERIRGSNKRAAR